MDWTLIEKSFNFHSLPCIYLDEKYVLFDPHSLRICSVDEREKLFANNALQRLRNFGFTFGRKIRRFSQKENHITLILTTDCNLACPYCYTESKKQVINLDPKIAVAILDSQINYDNRVFIQFFGGEPTLNVDCIRQIFRHVNKKTKNVFFYITTNGVMPERTLSFLIANKFGFYLSLDGTKEYHNKTRITQKGEGTFDKVIEVLNRILENNLAVKIRTTVTSENIDNMFQFAEYMFNLGVKIIHFCPLVSVGLGAHKQKSFSDEEFQSQFVTELDKVLDLARERGTKVLTPMTLALKKPSMPYCKIFHNENKILITPEGKRTLCFGAQGEYNSIAQHFIFGDFDLSKGEFVYREGVKERIIEAYQENLKQCSNCFAQFMCQGGCLAENLTLTGNMGQLPLSWCQMNRKLCYSFIERIYRYSKRRVSRVQDID